MALSLGIVGLPNVGKSTIFNSLTAAKIAAQNFPFCTIEPNVGVVPVPDERLKKLSEMVNPEKTIATTIEFVDIAGLVKDASKGEGLGNKFLANIRNTNAIAHVVRCFNDPNITHVNGKVDPIADINIIETELLLSDLSTIEKAIHKSQKNAKSNDKAAKLKLDFLIKLQEHCDNGKPARSFEVDTKDNIDTYHELHLLTAKPVMYIANVQDLKEDAAAIAKIEEYAKAEQALVVPISAKIEEELSELEAEEKEIFLEEIGLKSPGLDRVINSGYKLLNLITYFTAGKKEVRAWTVTKDSTAPQAAGVIHSDFERGFIRAEVISYNDFIECGGEQKAKENGKWRLEGKEYIVADGDILHFRFAT